MPRFPIPFAATRAGLRFNGHARSCGWFFLLIMVLPGLTMAAKSLSNSDCLDCHSEKPLTTTNAAGREMSLFVDAARLAAPVHGTNACVGCHMDVGLKHPDDNRKLAAVE